MYNNQLHGVPRKQTNFIFYVENAGYYYVAQVTQTTSPIRKLLALWTPLAHNLGPASSIPQVAIT